MRGKVLFNIVLAFFMLMAVISVAQGVHNAVGILHGSYDFQYDSALLLRLRLNPYDESLNPHASALLFVILSCAAGVT